VFRRVKAFLVHRRSIDPGQSWIDGIRRSMRCSCRCGEKGKNVLEACFSFQ
jgi:hypothetical protein